jgi:hypothetical protein
VKLFTTLLIAALAALAVYSMRRRIFLALRTGAIVYVIVLFARLLLSADSVLNRVDDLLWPLMIMVGAWAALWVVTSIYLERRARRRTRYRI